MRLKTLQPKAVYDEIVQSGRYVCDYSKTEQVADDDSDNFQSAYDWLVEKMRQRIGNPPVGVEYPVWAWYRNDDEWDIPVDDTGGKPYVVIEVEVDDGRVVLTDFDRWHAVLDDYPCVNESLDWDELNTEWDRLIAAGHEAVEESWQKVFEIDASSYVQATFWELRAEDIVSTREVFSKKYEESD